MEKEFLLIKKLISDEKFLKAEIICKRALKKYPNQNEFFYLMAVIYHSQKKFNSSLKYANKFLKNQPNQKDALLIKVYNQMALEENFLALETLLELGKIVTKNQDLNYLTAKNYEKIGNSIEAEIYYKKNLILESNQKNVFALINFYKNMKKFNQALDYLKNYKQPSSEIYHEISKIYFILRNFENSLIFLLKAENLNNKDSEIKKDLGFIYSVLGDEEKSLQFYQQAVDIKIDYGFVHFQISRIVNNIDREKLKNLILIHKNMKIKNENYIFLGLAISTYFDKKKLFQKSFSYLKNSNNLIRQDLIKNQNWKFENEIKNFDNTKLLFEMCSKNYLKTERTPIFILGLPRSGTTLVEQIISNHSSVHANGEIPHFQISLYKKLINIEKNNPESLKKKKISVEELQMVQKEYMKKIKTEKPFFTDKAPINYMYIGLIKKIFPNAKIILCTRNKFDNLLSMFQTVFSDKNYKFSYNFLELQNYYELYFNLIKFWKSKNILFYEIHYEELIKNTENSIKELLNFLEIEQQKSCYTFYKNKRPVLTASFNQVRKPIFTSSIRKWKNYEEFLK